MFKLYTIGHARHTQQELISLLQACTVTRLIDIRTVPRSRTNPQFNLDALPEALKPYHIDYQHLAALGGLRGKSKTTPPDVNGFWENDSFHHYADYALTTEFHRGLEELIALNQTQTCAIMCAETVWWRCHRRIVSDYLIARGIPVWHILGPGHVDAATLTRGAVIQADLTVRYPRPSTPEQASSQAVVAP